MNEFDLCKIEGEGYKLYLKDKDGQSIFLKITEEEAEIIMENLNVDVIDIPF